MAWASQACRAGARPGEQLTGQPGLLYGLKACADTEDRGRIYGQLRPSPSTKSWSLQAAPTAGMQSSLGGIFIWFSVLDESGLESKGPLGSQTMPLLHPSRYAVAGQLCNPMENTARRQGRPGHKDSCHQPCLSGSAALPTPRCHWGTRSRALGRLPSLHLPRPRRQ